jgi:glutathione S-transferase
VDEKTRGNYTRWFTEALAQYWERELTGFQFASPEGDLHQELYPLKKMDRQFDNLPNQALAYSQSLAIADYLYQEHGHLQVEQLLAELGKGASMNQAFLNIIGLDLHGFEQEFHRWLRAIYPAGQAGKPAGANEKKPQVKKAHWARIVS